MDYVHQTTIINIVLKYSFNHQKNKNFLSTWLSNSSNKPNERTLNTNEKQQFQINYVIKHVKIQPSLSSLFDQLRYKSAEQTRRSDNLEMFKFLSSYSERRRPPLLLLLRYCWASQFGTNTSVEHYLKFEIKVHTSHTSGQISSFSLWRDGRVRPFGRFL